MVEKSQHLILYPCCMINYLYFLCMFIQCWPNLITIYILKLKTSCATQLAYNSIKRTAVAGGLLFLGCLVGWVCIEVGMSGPGKCGSCASNIANNKFLICYLCHKDYHSSCLSDWRDISKASDLDLLNRPGVVWYCLDCVPQLQGYVHAPQLEKKVDKIEGDIGRLGDLLRESL